METGQAGAYFLAKKWNDLGADSGHSFGDLRLLVHFHVEAVGHFIVLEQRNREVKIDHRSLRELTDRLTLDHHSP